MTCTQLFSQRKLSQNKAPCRFDVERYKATLREAALWLGVVLALLACEVVSQAHAVDEAGIIQTNLGLVITLSEESQQAINNGVPLTFVCRFAMPKKFAFAHWNTTDKTHRFMVSRHALSNRYLVRVDNIERPKIFPSLSATMSYIGSTAKQLFNNYAAQRSEVRMRLSLSKYELPGPMRLNAFISSDWNLDTGWIEWTSEG